LGRASTFYAIDMANVSFVHACCRCMWPFGGSRALAYFSDSKKNEDYEDEESHHLLGNVIDSDDEQVQADALSPDQIKRFLDASKSSRPSTSSAQSRREPGRRQGAGDDAGLSRPVGATPATRSASTSAPGEYDEFFDEELEDEPENVVGAKFRYLAKRTAPEDSGSFSPMETDGRGLGFGGARPPPPEPRGPPAVPVTAHATGSLSFGKEEDDDDDDEVAGPLILPSSPPAFLDPGSMNGVAGPSLSSAVRTEELSLAAVPGMLAQATPSVPLLTSPVSWDAADSIILDGDSIILDGDSEGHFAKDVPEATAVAG